MTTLRIHPPAGRLEPEDWIRLSQESENKADGFVYLCKDSAFELRNLKEELAAELVGLHCATVVPSPLSQTARAVAREVATRLPKPQVKGGHAQSPIFSTPRIGIDGGDGDVARLGLEVCVKLRGQTATIDVAGKNAFTDIELADIFEVISGEFGRAEYRESQNAADGHCQAECPPPLGWLPTGEDECTVNLGAAVVNNAIPAAYAEMIGRMEVPTSITAWGGLVFHDLLEQDADVVLRFLAPRGFIFDAHSPLLDSH